MGPGICPTSNDCFNFPFELGQPIFNLCEGTKKHSLERLGNFQNLCNSVGFGLLSFTDLQPTNKGMQGKFSFDYEFFVVGQLRYFALWLIRVGHETVPVFFMKSICFMQNPLPYSVLEDAMRVGKFILLLVL